MTQGTQEQLGISIDDIKDIEDMADVPMSDNNGFDPSGFDSGGDDYQFEDMDNSGVDGSQVGSGTLKVDHPGFYHFRIEAIPKPSPFAKGDMMKKLKPHILLCLEVLHSAPRQSPAGSMFYHQLILGGEGGGAMSIYDKERTNNFLVGLGILIVKGTDIIDPETGTVNTRSSTLAKRLNAIKQFAGKIEMGKGYEHKATRKWIEGRLEFPWGHGAFPINSPTVAHIPKNLEAIKEAGIVMPVAANGQKPNM